MDYTMMDNFMMSLEIMAKGMGGIFAALIIIMISVWIMARVFKK